MNILEILEEIADNPSTNIKKDIIQREKDNNLLKKVFQAAYNTKITYGIKIIPDRQVSDDPITLSSAIDSLIVLSNRMKTGNAASVYLSELLGKLSLDDSIVLSRIIQRDLRCGCSDTIVAKVWKNLITKHGVMLAYKDISGIKYPAYGQTKCLSGDWLVEDEDGKKYKISDVVDNRIKINVKSYDFNKNSVIFKPITDFHDNGISNDMVEIKYKLPNGTIKKTRLMTSTHELWNTTQGCWTTSLECEIGDYLLLHGNSI